MSILSTAVLGVILILYSFYLYFQLQDVLYRNLDAELKVKAHELAKTVKAFQDTKSPGGDIRYAALKVLGFGIEEDQNTPITLADRQWFRLVDRYDLNEDYVSILSLEGETLASSSGMPPEVNDQLAGLFEKHRRIRSTWDTISYNGTEMRVLQMMMFSLDKPHFLVQIATPLTTVNQLLQERLWGIVASIPVILILSSLAGLFFANRILHPVRKITETAERLTHEDLSRRVEVAHVDTEMLFLVRAFNKMIKRLEASFKHVTEMTSHIAHELKTPLAIIRGEGQMALRREQPPEKYREVIQSGIEETTKMLRVIDDLLIATKLAYDKEIFTFKPVPINRFLKEIHQKSEILAEPKNMRIELKLPSREVTVQGDPTHLRRLVFNIIDNAVKYSRPQNTVQLSATCKNGGVVIAVRDQGEGIAPEDLPRIFERTFHKSPAKGEHGEYTVGTGLGLHLCRAIAEAHYGKLSVESHPGQGSTFSLHLPLKYNV